MINTEKERAKALRRLNGLKIFENRTKGLIQSIGIDYEEPLRSARKEIELLELEISEFDHLLTAKTTPISSAAIREIPKFLLQTRYRVGWTQAQLAKEIGISPQLMCKYEKNYTNLKLRTLVEIVEILEVTLRSRLADREAYLARVKSNLPLPDERSPPRSMD